MSEMMSGFLVENRNHFYFEYEVMSWVEFGICEKLE